MTVLYFFCYIAYQYLKFSDDSSKIIETLVVIIYELSTGSSDQAVMKRNPIGYSLISVSSIDILRDACENVPIYSLLLSEEEWSEVITKKTIPIVIKDHARNTDSFRTGRIGEIHISFRLS